MTAAPDATAAPQTPYQQLRLLVSAPRQARSIAIGSRFCPPALATLERLGLAGVVASAAVDRQLLEARQAAAPPGPPGAELEDPGPLLCLRCRVSQAADQKIQALVRRFGRSHQLDPIDLAATVLDDVGAPLPWPTAGQEASRHRPFALQVISSFQPDLAGLGHWTRVRVQSHPPLVRLLREHGLLLLRDWSLLAHASPARMARAWRLHGSAALPAALVVALHGRFRDRYRQERRGAPRSIGRWEPDAAFLVALDPPAPAALTLQRLQAMAAALRRDQLASLPLAASEALEHVAAAAPAPAFDHLAVVEAALRQAVTHQLPAMLAADGPEAELRACFWRHYARGLNQRAIGQACDGSCQAKVQRRLQLAAHAAVIATTALGQLAGREGFEAVGRSPERTEAQLAALAEHLLAIPDGGDRSRLALWLSPLLDPPAASSP